MSTIQSQSTSSPCVVAQKAAIAALKGPQDFIKNVVKGLTEKRNFAHDFINKIPYLNCSLPSGAFYLFINCSGLTGKKTPNGNILKTSDDFVRYLLETEYLAVVDGKSFGAENYFRISYAVNETDLKESCKRMLSACEKLSS